MTSIGVVTFHRASNYGAVLQAYALQEVLRSLGHKSEVIDYHSEFLENHYKPAPISTLLRPRKLAAAIVKNGYMRDRRSIFADFRSNWIPMSEKVNADGLASLSGRYDTVITGSDQVWNAQTAGFDENYFLSFVSPKVRKTAYAASIGVPQIPESLSENYQNLLRDFDFITMRERTGAEALAPLLGYQPATVLDPTLLLSRDQWARKFNVSDCKEPYILMYLLAESPRIVSYARELSEATGMEVRYISHRLFHPRGAKVIDKADPVDFVRSLLCSAALVTNSFHGIAFGINFGLDLHYDLLPPSSSVNSRITDIAKRFALENRRIENRLLSPRLPESIDASYAQLAHDRTDSQSLLLEMVGTP